MNIINFNGEINTDHGVILQNNRAFLYADALFDTLIYHNDTFIFLEDHFFRLLLGMRQLRMEIPNYFTQDFWQKEMLKTVQANSFSVARVRTTIFRDSDGLFTPEKNFISFMIQVSNFSRFTKEEYNLGLYKDNHVNTNSIDNIKTTNRLTNVLASIYSKDNGFDNCILINNNKQVAEAINGNIFAVFGNQIITPALSEGCIAGIIRKKLIDFIQKSKAYTIEETILTPFEIQNADELFITNSVIGIQPVTKYKRKKYKTTVGLLLQKQLCNNFEP